MKNFLKKLTVILFGSMLMISLAHPVLAQNSLFDDSLDKIKNRLEENREGEKPVQVIDYSNKRPWGNLEEELPPGEGEEVIQKLKPVSGNLDELKEAIDELELDNVSNAAELLEMEEREVARMTEGEIIVRWLEKEFELTNKQANVIYNEMTFRGESQLNTIGLEIIRVMRNLIGGLAIIFIIIATLRMALAQGEEGPITEGKKHIIFAVIGLGIILLMEQLIYVIYGTPGTAKEIITRDFEFSNEIYGIVAYLKSLMAALAVFMIVLSGVKTLTAVGEEEKIKKQRVSIVWVGIGLVLIIINKVIVENLFITPNENASTITNQNVANIIVVLTNVVKFALGFVGLIAFGVMLYGGGLFIANYANEELAEKAKKIIKFALMGIVIILSAYAITASLIDFS